MSATTFTPVAINAQTKVIERFFIKRSDTKQKFLELGFSEVEADAKAVFGYPEEALENALILITRSSGNTPILRASAREIVRSVIGDPAPVELQRYRWAESQGSPLKPYQSLADKLAASRSAKA